jgi:5-formyltetrahydrofolate cyclo-ligase
VPDDDTAAAIARAAKSRLRSRLLAARAARSADARRAAASGIAAAALAYLGDRATPALVAAYLSVGSEPGTGPLLEELAARGVRLIVPVLVDGGDLDWASYAPGHALAEGLRRTIHPCGARLGVDAVRDEEAVIVPALAVDRRGQRLGRGGGSYDRALQRVAPGRPVLAVVYDDEVLDELPAESHDRAVDGALTASGVVLFGSHPPS